jgi:uncharacterized protein Usg
VILDRSGHGDVLARLHKHLGDNTNFCSVVAFTYWQEGDMGPDFIQQRSEFFAHSYIQKRLKEWAAEVFEQKNGLYAVHYSQQCQRV